MYKELFSPIKIRDMEMKNRVVFPAMGTKMAGDDKYVTQQIIDYQVERVRGGCGLNFLEVSGVHEPSTPNGFVSIGDDKYIPKLKELTDEIHREGGKVGIQLWQGGMAVLNFSPEKVYLASDLEVPGTDFKYKAMTKEEIKEIVKAYGAAAKRAVEAGFDCVEFHAGHNYLPHAFLSPAMNFRTDEYGGSLENRMRFSLECIEEIRKNIPEGMPIFMRVVAQDDDVENGLTIEDIIEFCKRAGDKGVDVLNVSRGNFISSAIVYEVPPIDLPRGFNVDNASRIKEETGMTTIAVGRINTPEQANDIIKDKKADMVVIGRGQLADPEFCNKAKEGRDDQILKCIGCNQGCYDSFTSDETPFISCMLNPAVGREREYRIEETSNPKTVLIAGAGMAGLEAGIVLKRRGHNPIICEASEDLGGQFVLAGEAPRKDELKASAYNMGHIAKTEGVDIRFNTPVNKETIEDINPDEVIIAIGAGPLIPNIKGIDLPHVFDAHSVLAKEHEGDIKGRVIVIGGGLVGLEVAEYVRETNENITVIEMMDEVAKDLGDIRKIMVMKSLAKEGIKTKTSAKCSEILEDGVMIEVDGEMSKVEGDTVIIAIGARSKSPDEIVEACEIKGLPYHSVGDVIRPRRALNAILESSVVAREI